MRAAIKRAADIVLMGFGVLLLVLVVTLVVHFRRTVELSGSGGIGAVSASGSLLVTLLVAVIGIAGLVRLVYLVVRSLFNAARPLVQRPRE